MFPLVTFLYIFLILNEIQVYGAPNEVQTLLSLKASLAPPHGSMSTWLENSEYHHLENISRTAQCAWSGIECNKDGNVIALRLSGLGLSGYIPSFISELHNLQEINLSNNDLLGEIPKSFSDMPSLRVVNISANFLNGKIDVNFSAWHHLEVLDVYNNELTGQLPNLSGLSNLKVLKLGGNFFRGTIPAHYSQLEKLEHLWLQGNQLSGQVPKELGKLSSLKYLFLGYYNAYEGGIPPEFGNLLSLVRLDMGNCSLTGAIPPELGRLEFLDTLFLQLNSLSGSIPPQLSKLESLMSLDLSNNNLHGEIPSEFQLLRNLTLLNLFNNSLYGEVPEFVGELPKLEALGLWQNNFTGHLPQRLGSNKRLLMVDVSLNRLIGTIPPSLCASMKLKYLILMDNFFYGPMPESLGKCMSLQRVRMGRNFLNGSLPYGFLNLPLLKLVELDDNDLTGSIVLLENSSNLKRLNLSMNKFNGPIPLGLGSLSGLQRLLLGGNHFDGAIPKEISSLQDLNTLDLSSNNLSGHIPHEVSLCKALSSLDISRNQLSGKIPIQITQLAFLNNLNMSSNKLSGDIPRELVSMTSLVSLDLSFNDLSGSFPNMSFFNSSSFLGNPKLCLSCDFKSSTKPHMSFTLKLFLIGLFSLLVFSIAFYLAKVSKPNTISAKGSWRLTAFQKLNFSSHDIVACLEESNIIGKGGAGTVYRGLMPSGEQVAIKKLERGNCYDHGFGAEIRTLGTIRHRHIVKLLGFCSKHDVNLLVYEYMSNGSLGDMLHGTKGGFLRWETRLQVAMDAAKGLSYLHHGRSPPILHRDVKSNNILLGSNYEAKVADFGLAKFMHDSQSLSSVAGSYGYIAPEYAYTLDVNEKSDVYSYGVVLLELITGRRPLGGFGEGVGIVEWVKKLCENDKGEVVNVVDKRLSTIPIVEVMGLFDIAMLCVGDDFNDRPNIREVLHMLASLNKTFRPS